MSSPIISSIQENRKFIEGKDDWLFLDADSNKVNEQISGRKILSIKQVQQWCLLLEMRKAWLKSKGISYFFLIAPAKGCIYPEFLPPSISIADKRCINQIRTYLSDHSSSVELIYPIEELKLAKSRRAVYPKKDTHWNKFGAFVAYQALISHIASNHRVRVLTESDIKFENCSVKYTDLGIKTGSPDDQTISAQIPSRFSKLIFDNKVRNRGKLLIFENKKYKYLPKGVMFRDSFSNMMLGFLAESFSRLVVVWQPNIDYSIILSEKPDIVISQQAERFISRMPNDLTGETNEEIIASKSLIGKNQNP